jgi:glycosyltransferase involved in cell wall biosynthesis
VAAESSSYRARVSPSSPADSIRPHVVILRGHQANPWELGPWERPAIADHFEVSYLRSRRGWFDTTAIQLTARQAWTIRDLLPPGRLGDLAVRIPGDRYLGLSDRLREADIVHIQELGYWYSAQAAALKPRHGFRLVTTVWETIPLLDAYRNLRTRPYRARVLAQTDLFLAASERARAALLLEGADPNRVRVSPPGIAAERFAEHSASASDVEPLVLSPGRLVWEKGHQDVLRAVALLRSGLAGPTINARVQIVGRGPEEHRLRAYARELGLEDAVTFSGMVPYAEMPEISSRASCVVLASLATWFWEEQFGMVLAEAIHARTPILASTSGAIPEVAGAGATYFSPGDWVTLARLLAELLGAGDRDADRSGVDEVYTNDAAAIRIADAYEAVLRSSPRDAPRGRA